MTNAFNIYARRENKFLSSMKWLNSDGLCQFAVFALWKKIIVWNDFDTRNYDELDQFSTR